MPALLYQQEVEDEIDKALCNGTLPLTLWLMSPLAIANSLPLSSSNIYAGDRLARWQIQRMEFNALINYSPFTIAHDNDEHYTGYHTFRVKARRGKYWAASMDAVYYLSSQVKVLTALSWENYRQNRGQIQGINYVAQSYNYSEKEGGGLSHKNYSLTAGLQYHS